MHKYFMFLKLFDSAEFVNIEKQRTAKFRTAIKKTINSITKTYLLIFHFSCSRFILCINDDSSRDYLDQ